MGMGVEVTVRQFTRRQVIWGMGLSDAESESVRSLAGKAYSLKLWPAGSMPDFAEAGKMAAPCMICFGIESCRQFMVLPVQQIGFLDLTPKALFLKEDADMATIDEAISLGVSDIIRPPFTNVRFSTCLRKAAEAAALQRDIQNMAHEVFIEREMLEQKNKALSFLVTFCGQISESLDETELLSNAFACFQNLFPVLTMHAGVFSKDDNGALTADLFVAAPKDSQAYGMWRERLLEANAALYENATVNPTTTHLPLANGAATTARPEDGHLLTLPVNISDGSQLYLMLLTSMERNLSRDQALALDSALRHMAITIKNVRRYQRVCHFADRDSLTGAYNRRFFEQALQKEIARHKRYNEEFSLLILDIDHFKHINDSFGHLKGDDVLRAVVSATSTTVRQTDYCIRYGGEEFVVMLPHTSSRNAAWLAERLRKKVQRLVFESNKGSFSVSISIGVSSIAPGEIKEETTLLGEADQALYLAKSEGRNKVVVHRHRENVAASN